jgi:hypothetical protein
MILESNISFPQDQMNLIISLARSIAGFFYDFLACHKYHIWFYKIHIWYLNELNVSCQEENDMISILIDPRQTSNVVKLIEMGIDHRFGHLGLLWGRMIIRP